MKFCQNCGKEVMDQAVICPGCGCALNTNAAPQTQAQPQSTASVIENDENPKIQRFAVVFAFFLPIVGLILGIIGTVKYKNEKLKKQCIYAIIISIVMQVISLFLYFNNL